MSYPRSALDADRVGDAMQAAYFRESLVGEREQLATYLAKQRDEITRRTHQGQHSALSRLRSNVRSVEAELRHVDGLINRLDRRFANRPATQLPS